MQVIIKKRAKNMRLIKAILAGLWAGIKEISGNHKVYFYGDE
jgi:hypothetical protein